LPKLAVAEGFFDALKMFDEEPLSELYYDFNNGDDSWADRDKWTVEFY